MDRLFKTYGRLLAQTDLNFTRYLYGKINWDNRLIVIKGAKGVGKTTMLLQHILRTFEDKQKALYASLDHIWFVNHSILDLPSTTIRMVVPTCFWTRCISTKDGSRKSKTSTIPIQGCTLW